MDSVPLLPLHFTLCRKHFSFCSVALLRHGTAPESNTAFLELFHPSATQGTLAQPTASSSARWRTSVCLDTREPIRVSLLFLSDNRKPQVPSPRIKLCAQPKHTPGWGPVRKKPPQPWLQTSSFTFDAFLLALGYFWNKSPSRFTAPYTGGLQESRVLPAIAGAVQVPMTNKRNHLSCAQGPLKGPRAKLQQRKGLLVARRHCQQPVSARLQLKTLLHELRRPWGSAEGGFPPGHQASLPETNDTAVFSLCGHDKQL